MLQLLKDRNFLTFWVGEFVSVIGDHISLIAFPLLVLQMTENVALTGIVFAVQGLPRAVLMLYGGALVDRYSPRRVMMLSNMLRFLLVITISYLIYIDQAQVGMIFGFALAFGIVDAFFYPASVAIVPSLLPKETLQKGNALVQASVFVGVIIGPALAGLIIAGELTTMGHDAGAAADYQSNRMGFARAFFLDALTFAASFTALYFVRTRKLGVEDGEEKGEPAAEKPSMLGEIKEGVKWVWSKPTIRLAFLGIAFLEFFFQTPIFIGLPALAKARYLEPAFVYGLMISAYGGGALIGSVLGGSLKPVGEKYLVRIMFLIFMGSGASIGLIVLYDPYWWAMLCFFISGAGDSFIWVNITTWIQKKTPENLLGRVMSIFTFLAVGLIPIAGVLMGFAFEWNLELSLLFVSGILVSACLVAAIHRDAVYSSNEDEADGQPQEG